MMLNDENKKDLKKMMKGRAVYLALAVCVLAAGFVSAVGLRGGQGAGLRPDGETEAVTYMNIGDRVLPESATVPPAPPATTQAPVSEPAVPQTEASAAPVFDNASPTVPSGENETEAARAPVFSLPLNTRVGRDYSMGVPVFSETMGDYRTHNGADFPGEAGAAVTAVAAGTVTSVSADPLYGNTVTVAHAGGFVSAVSGLADEGLIEVGAKVTGETVIGLVGRLPAEEKEGSHIHLEIRRDGALVDPLEVLGVQGEEE